jgi:hypothetical protein
MEASLALMLLVMTVITVTQTRVTDLFGGSRPKEPSRVVAPVPGWDRFADVAGQRILTTMTNKIADMPQTMEISFDVGPRGHLRNPRIEHGSGSPAIDHMIEAQLLPGMELMKPPPGLPMPLVMRVSIMSGGWLYSLEPPDS